MTSTTTPTRPRVHLRAASITAVLTAVATALGFGRDLLMARIFGASTNTDAFLVAWMIPETAAPVLIEGALSFLLVPLFSRAIERKEDVREVLSATLPPISAVLLGLTVVTAIGAPWLVGVLAPGIPEAGLAANCMRLTSVTILMFGLAGYLSAGLRSHQRFTAPATIYVAYNLGIIGFICVFHEQLGVLAVALGVMAGSVGMVAVQLPSFVRRVGLPRLVWPAVLTLGGAFIPIAAFSLLRQGQVFVERFLGSSLAAGSISHMNYAQKIAQVPMVLSLVVATVTFPQLVRSITAGDTVAARRRITHDLLVAGVIVLLATAALVVFAPEIVRLLLEYGAFSADDTAATVAIMRLYSLGLFGQAVVGVACRVYFCVARPTWYPAASMTAGLALTAVVAVAATPYWGAGGIAVANATGITATAAILLAGLRGPAVALSLRALVAPIGCLLAAAVAATAAGWLIRPHLEGLPSALALVLGCAVMALAFCAVAAVAGSKEFVGMLKAGRTGDRA